VVLLALAPGKASAQHDREADAERLFREGQKLLEERRFGEACPKFEQAYAFDRQLGTLINLAFCHKEQGAIWYAWLEFREAEVKASEGNRIDRRDFAKQQLTDLEKTLPKLVIDNAEKVALSEVLVDDRRVWDADKGTSFAAEPGQRRFVFRAKGKKSATLLIGVATGTKVQHVVAPELEDLPTEAPSASEHPVPLKSPDTGAPSTGRGDDAAPQKTFGWVALGVGGAAGALGAVTGLMTLTSTCAGGAACRAEDRSSARTSGTISDVSFVLAALGIGGGVALLVTARKAEPSRSARARSGELRISPGVGSVAIQGAFW
jgi:hypothetical protein